MYDHPLEVLSEDGERIWYRTRRYTPPRDVVLVLPAAEHPAPEALDRLANEYALREQLDSAWAARPLELVRERGRTILVLEFPGGEPLERLVGAPLEISKFLPVAAALATAVGRVHERGLIHKDIKPANVLVDWQTTQVWLTGFGIASRSAPGQQQPEPLDLLAGTLAYMAPEQTGRMSRSVDSRSDLYSLGITLYQMLTGSLPFVASDPMEWVHCHIAKRPVAPGDKSAHIPTALSAVILKLLAKTPEERYQTAAGVERDLQRCLSEWEATGRVADFTPGLEDIADRMLIPGRLYGRKRESKMLLTSLERVVATGHPELVLISGYSGIGKSSLVQELNEALITYRGLFASGKFDQYTRDTPYNTLTQAFRSLVRPLLGRSQAEVQAWRDALHSAVEPNGALLLGLVPDLKLILGELPPVPGLAPHDEQRRFQQLLRRFIAVFARPGQPLVLFLDDLQWLDAATLEFLEDLMTQPDVRYLLLIGAYRDNEVMDTHPLMRKVQAIRKAGTAVHNIALTPLIEADLQLLLADSLHCQPEHVVPLAHLVHEKTAGNPFFAIQFLTALVEGDLLTFDRRRGCWCWDLQGIQAKGYTDNVVDLIAARLNRVPVETRAILQQLACIGTSAELGLICALLGESPETAHERLWTAVSTGLLLRAPNGYRFAHDRVREAAYSLLSESLRAPTHLRIGRLLRAQTPSDRLEERIFEIANQLNRAAHLLTCEPDRRELAQLNLAAARIAKSSTAYVSALNYLSAGRALLSELSWQHDYELIFPIEYIRAECELLTAQMEVAERRLTMLAERARSAHDIALVTRLLITLYTALDRSDRAVEICLDYLRRAGTDWSPHPSTEDVRTEYDLIWSALGERQIEELVDLPWMTDADVLDTLEVLTEIVTPTVFFDQNLCSLVICRMTNLSLRHGNSDGSCFAYVWFGIIAGPLFGRYDAGFRFGSLGYELVERRGLKRYQARTYMSFGNLVMPWVKHALEGRDLVRRAFDTAYGMGDYTFAAYSLQQLLTNYLAVGDRLPEVQQEAERALAFARNTRFGLVVDLVSNQLQLVRSLRGLTEKFGCFDDEGFREVEFERHLAGNPSLADVEFGYWGLKTQARFLAQDYAAAVEASFKAQPLFWAAPSLLEPSAFRYYAGLSHAAFWDRAPPDRKPVHYEALLAFHAHLQTCAEHCPANFENRAVLLAAEIARIQGHVLEAENLYDRAIRSARENNFVHNEAVANEAAARFFLSRGLETLADAHLKNAAACFTSWGADGKVEQLEARYPRLISAAAHHATAFGVQLDVATVVKASQAVSSEIVLPRLVERLMTIALQSAGADRGLLLLPYQGEYRIEAEALLSDERVTIRRGPAVNSHIPETLIRYVARTQESVIVNDVTKPNLLSNDEYLKGSQQPRSLLCLPILRQGASGGLLYLENTLVSYAFTPRRTAVLEMLASQAAISLENTRLYGDLQEREAKVRRLIDANIVGIALYDLNGDVVEANQAFLEMVGYSREDVVSGRLDWRQMTPAEWHETDRQKILELRATGRVRPYEKEFFFKATGHRVPVLIGAAGFEGEQDRGFSFVWDLTARKKAEEAARESERRFREVESTLAHANRVATMGQLSASIAHELNQPIAAAVTNAQAALNWLGAEPADMKQATDAISRIIKNGTRAGDVLARIRALVKKAPPRKDWLDLNAAIGEIIALIHGEIVKNGVCVQSSLEEQLPAVQGDRVQLQQVLLNLTMNALEAMKSVGNGSRHLLISTARSDSVVQVSVQDSGPGLPGGADRMFEPFYTTKPGGLGIGLSICRAIVQSHGGSLWASANEPRGANFQFTLPVASDPSI
jgi:PAS domain S-box-containing protein